MQVFCKVRNNIKILLGKILDPRLYVQLTTKQQLWKVTQLKYIRLKKSFQTI